MPQTTYKINTFAAYPGMLADLVDLEIATGVNAEVTTLPAGIMVAYKTGAPTATSQVIYPIANASSANGIPAGIVVHTHAADTIGLQTQSTDLIFKTGALVGLLRKGNVFVSPEVTVVEGDPVFYRISANGGNNNLGAFTNVSDTTHTQEVFGARFLKTSDVTASGFMAPLSFDMNAFLAGVRSLALAVAADA